MTEKQNFDAMEPYKQDDCISMNSTFQLFEDFVNECDLNKMTVVIKLVN